jgi:ribosomal biogenesis protein LAS1
MAFSQFVTGLCDTPQTKTTARRSMYEVANDIGLPQSWVEVRHEITHGTMPELHILQKATEDAIEWLWNRFWSSMGEKNELESQRGQRKLDTIKDLVISLLPAKMEEIKAQKSGSVNEIIGKIGELCITTTELRLVAATLAEQRLLMPKRKMYVSTCCW